MKKQNILILLSVSLVSLMCERQTDWDFHQSDRFIVADCIITNELKNQEVRLYTSSPGYNNQPEGISGAIIEISDGWQHFDFIEDTLEKGKYISSLPFRASAGNLYQLNISYNGINDTAYAEMVPVTPLESFSIVEYDSLFRFIYNESESASMTEVYYDWSAVPEYCREYSSCNASEVFYSLKYIDPGKEFAPDRIVIPFPRKTIIIRKKYSLSDEHQRFIRSLLFETEWRGGFFDIEQDNVITNFHHGIRGWFAACMTLSDTTFFE
jgi:hypothetical protein